MIELSGEVDDFEYQSNVKRSRVAGQVNRFENRATCLFVGLIAGIGLVISPSILAPCFWGRCMSDHQVPSPQEVSGSVPLFQADINRADVIELQLLPGIGPKSAEEILRVRSGMGGFQVLQDLDRVDGIGKKTMEQLKSVIRFESHSRKPSLRVRLFASPLYRQSANDRVR